VDYVLTITVSIAAAGDALFSFVPPMFHEWKLPFQLVCVIGLTLVNMRGVKESVMSLMPVFVLFLITHVVLILGGIAVRAPLFFSTVHTVTQEFHVGVQQLGVPAMMLLFVHAYSLG